MARNPSGLTRAKPARTNKKKRVRKILPMTDTRDVIVPGLTGRYPQDQFRHGDYLHVSDLLYRCVRKIALSELLSEDIHAETVWPGRALTFTYGHATEDFVRDRLKQSMPRELYGHWQCPCEHTLIKNRTWHKVKDVECPKCGKPPMNYKEVVIRDREYMVTGSIDIVFLIEGYFYLNECKSMARAPWEALTRPMPEHLLQILLYWWAVRRKGKKLWDQVSILYANKEFMFAGLPYKEFKFRPSTIIDRLDPLLEEAAQLVEFRNSIGNQEAGAPVLPPRTMCETCEATDAKKCQFSSVCFQMGA